MKRNTDELFDVTVENIAPGGQGIGHLADGKAVFVWNALPGEQVQVRLIKQKRNYAEGIAERVIEASHERVEPRETNYLATSPWQMMAYAAENRYKNNIVTMLLEQAHMQLAILPETVHDERQWHYRNKMEYSLWGDDQGLHLALYNRGSHLKQIVSGSSLAMPAIDATAHAIVARLNAMDVRAGDLKTIVVRCDQAGNTVASLFMKPEKFPQLQLPSELQGLRVYHSNPKSPASVPTKLLHEIGDVTLRDELAGHTFRYDVDSFFQVNPPVFEQALRRIKVSVQADDITDMYAGVGSIGLSVANKAVTLVELHAATANMARDNFATSGLKGAVVEASTEKTLEYITSDKPVIFDPPRAGLHQKVIERVLEVKPPQIVYLSCNPATQIRDLALLQEAYDIAPIEVFNFFPRTPHIETLTTLTRKA
jgi:23S rRNA (uracil1939-C5)-methyltransferase